MDCYNFPVPARAGGPPVRSADAPARRLPRAGNRREPGFGRVGRMRRMKHLHPGGKNSSCHWRGT
jgi:hypothetical protein